MPRHAVRRIKRDRSTLRSYFLLLAGNVAVPIASFMTGPLLARGLGVADRGSLGGLLALVIIAPTVVSFGLQDSTIVMIHRLKNFPHVLTRSALAGLALGTLGGVVITAAATVIHEDMTWLMIVAVASYVLLWVVSIPFRAVLIARSMYRWIAAEKWIQAFSRLALMCFLFFSDRLTIESALVGHISCSLIGSLFVVCPALMLSVSMPAQIRPAGNQPSTIFSLLRIGRGVWAGSVAGVLLLRLDQLVMPVLTTPDQLGLYVVAVSVVEVGLILSASARLVLLPRFLATEDTSGVFKYVWHFVLLTAAATGAAFFTFPLIIPFLFGDEFRASADIATILVPAVLAAMWLDVAGAASTSLGQQSRHAGILWAAVLVSAGLIPLLVPLFGAFGAAYTTLASYGVAAVVATLRLARAARLRSSTNLLHETQSASKGRVREP